MATILIASLGESPIVVTSMLDLLQEKLKQLGDDPIDVVEVLVPQGDMIRIGYDLIAQELNEKCPVVDITLPFEDANSEEASYSFLRYLAQQLSEHQKNSDTVYLSLAGGRKNMSALMAMLAPLYPCVKKLYHIHDKDEHTPGHHFLSIEALFELSDTQRMRLLFPDHEKVHLIELPYGEKQQADPQFMSQLLTLTDEQLDDLWENEPQQAETLEDYRSIVQDTRIIPIEMTKDVVKKYRQLRRRDALHARGFAICFRQMRYVGNLVRKCHDVFHYKDKSRSLNFHFYKRYRSVERPFFYTEPQDVCVKPDGDVKRLVITALEIEVEGEYTWGDELLKSLKFPMETVSLEKEFPRLATVEDGEGNIESIIVIPLGTSPMVATQLVTLFEANGHKLHKIVLLSTKHRTVLEGAKILREAFQGKGLKCQEVVLSEEDIDSTAACKAYQDALEKIIDEIRVQQPNCQIELTISGGRKGMAALTMFAAQQKDIRYVYHTLITDEAVYKKVSDETTIEELRRLGKISKKSRDGRLFLDAYEQYKDAFELFKVPVVPVSKG